MFKEILSESDGSAENDGFEESPEFDELIKRISKDIINISRSKMYTNFEILIKNLPKVLVMPISKQLHVALAGRLVEIFTKTDLNKIVKLLRKFVSLKYFRLDSLLLA